MHNSIPTTFHGFSPFFILFGIEPTFPGWQQLKKEVDESLRSVSRQEARHRLLIHDELIARDISLMDSPTFVPGQWIAYYLSGYERSKVHNVESQTSLKYSPTWSLPCRIAQVKDNVLIVHEMGLKGFERQVPISQVKLLKSEIPEPLAEVNLKLLETAAPVYTRRCSPRSKGDVAATQQLDDLIEEAFRNRKRRRVELHQ